MVLRTAGLLCLLCSACTSEADAVAPTGSPTDGGMSGGTGGGSIGPSPFTVVRFSPPDVSTATGSIAPGVELDTNGPPIPAALAQDLQGLLTLRTWPEYTEVPATATASGANVEAGRPFPGVGLNPDSPLADRWYVVRLASVPTGASLPLPASYRVLPDGALGARFRTGSDPVLWGIRVCTIDGANYKVRLEFSERITTSVDVGTIVVVSQAEIALTCEVKSSPAWPNGEWAAVALACSGIDQNVPLTVSLADGLQSMTGQPVVPFTYDFTPHDLPAIESACGVYRP